MAQSARKYEEFDQMDQVPIPAGGIATFLTAETGSWADEDDVMPRQGIAQVHQIADKLAEYGRNEDEYMIHAAEGETVIPMEVFDQNPTLRNKLFAEMRIMGIEPERYVVGNELNSINPVTGQPEFFLKKLFKGLKKIVKMVLPVIATIGLTVLTGGIINPVMAGAIVSGASTAIQGGSLKDSLKSAAIGGIAAFAGGRIAGRAGWAANSAKQAMTSAAINTALHGGSTKDVLTGAALAGVVTKGVDFVGAKIAESRTPPPTNSAQAGGVTGGGFQPATPEQLAFQKTGVTAATPEVISTLNPDLTTSSTGTGTDATAPVTLSNVSTRVVGMDMPYSVDNPMGYGAPTVQQFDGFMPGDQYSALNQQIPPPLSGALSPDYDVLGNLLPEVASSQLPAALSPDYDVLGNLLPKASGEFQAATPQELAFQNDASGFQPATPQELAYIDPLLVDATGTPVAVGPTGTPVAVGPNANLTQISSENLNTLSADAAPNVKADATLLTAPELPGAMDSFKDIFTGSGIEGEGFSSRLKAVQKLFLPGIDKGQATDYLKNLKTNDAKAYEASFGNKTISDAYRQMSKDAFQGVGGFARKYGPAIGAGLGLMALAPKPKQPELMDISNMPSGQDLIDADPSKYRMYSDDYTYKAPTYAVQNVAGSAPYFQPTALAAEGGIMNVSDFPRRNGDINGPGTGTSDDIPAMLSDGEFVFTAQAVRGAGKGNREDGMKNMYQMMRQFEAKA